MRMLKTQLIHDLVFIVEPTIRTKVAWARPECAGRNTNSKSTCEVQALRTVKAEERGLASPFQRGLVSLICNYCEFLINEKCFVKTCVHV